MIKKPETLVAVERERERERERESIYLNPIKSIYSTIHGYLKNKILYLEIKIYLIKNKGHPLLI